MSHYKITLLEAHRIKSVWKRGSENTIMGSVRLNTPLHTQPIVAAKLREELSDDYAIEIVDSRLVSPENADSYKELPYGEGTLEHFRVGMSLESERFRDIAKQSDVLGLTANFTQAAGVLADIARRAKQLNPGLKVVYGGSDARARIEHYLTLGGGDVVIVGDGERNGPRVVRALVGEDRLEDIPSIAYRDNGTLRRGPGPVRQDVPMDEVPLPSFDLVEKDLPQWWESHEGNLPRGVNPPLAYVETSRGCHETCPFCFSAGLKYRFMQASQIEQYSRHLLKWGIRSLMMISDNELTPLLMKRIKGMDLSGRELLMERYRIFRDYGFRWEFSNGLQYSMFSQNGRLDDELIEMMFSNCYRLFTPVEDPLDLAYDKLYGTPAERRNNLKSADEAFHEHHVRVLARIAATGLPMMTFGLIIGWPGDTMERVRRVAQRCEILRDAILESNPSCKLFFTPFIGIPIPGTKNWFDYQRNGTLREDVSTHPETWQFGLTTYGNFEMVDARLWLIAEVNGGEGCFREWTSDGVYPHHA